MKVENKQIYEKLEKEKKIKTELNRLNKLFKDFPKVKKDALSGLLNEAAFLRVSIVEVKEDIISNGHMEVFRQGDYEYDRERPVVKTYNTYVKTYQSTMKLILDQLPKEVKNEEESELMKFVKEGLER